MSFLLDTNVPSEWVKPHPDPNVEGWVASVDEDRVFLSVIAFAEIRRGVEIMPAGRRRERLALWLADELPARFEGGILSITREIAEAWGLIMARGQRAEVTLGSTDAFIAATALVGGLTLVTRDVRDFQATGIPILNPWEPRS